MFTIRSMAWIVALVGLVGGTDAFAGPADRAEPADGAGPADEIVFERHVRPILKAHCFQCHGEEVQPKGGLDVRLVRLMREGGDSDAAIYPGDPEGSLLWQRIESDEMPEGPKKLSDEDKQIIREWIAQGAATARPEPEDPDDAQYTEEELGHWAFQRVAKADPPVVENAECENAIDRFIAARLADQGLSFAPLADRLTLIRRVTFDLTGLPPTAEEVEAFVQDTSPDAWPRLVDRLLNSPQYGIRWGRHWMDVAGYSESDGNLGNDQARPHAWHYRDYVVGALNNDLPYDQFLVEQLAGDELIGGPPDGNNPRHVELMSATGFLRMAPDITETSNTLQDRNQAVAETVKVVSSALLGLTVGCAQCHDHRYDPISTEDYYRFRAVFDPAFSLHQWRKPSERIIDLTDDATRAAIDAIEARAVTTQEDINQRRREHCRGIQEKAIESAPAELRERLRTAVNTPGGEQTDEQKQLLDKHPTVKSIDWIVGQLIEYDREAHTRFQAEEVKVAELRQTKPLGCLVMAVSEVTEPVPPSTVFFRGDPESPQEPVAPAELTVMRLDRPMDPIPLGEPGGRSTGRRLAYARQLTDGTHPLVARVAVNRIWSRYFGRGLVATTGDFGLAGDRPSHPKLLDYLAGDFVRGGWRMKRLHRQIVTSRTYRQSSHRQAGNDSDPENILLGRMPLRRLDAESIRDSLLMVSGSLNRQLDGPSVPVAEDDEGKAVIGTRTLLNGLFSGIESAGDQEFRRSIYISARRDLPLNLLDTFDMPAMNPNCLQRHPSTVAPQALWFLNDEQIVSLTETMARSLVREYPESVDDQIRAAYMRALTANATPEEIQTCAAFVGDQSERFRADPDPQWQETLKLDPGAAHARGLASLCQVLMSSNRFLYLP